MRIIAVDQSTVVTAYSVWENGELINHGQFVFKSKGANTYDKLEYMGEAFSKLIKQYRPDYICIEGVQFQKNYRTYSILSQLQGVLMGIMFKNDLGFCVVEPSAWKSHIGIKSRKRVEQKQETISFVKNTYNLSVSEDEADAIGIGIWAKDNVEILQ